MKKKGFILPLYRQIRHSSSIFHPNDGEWLSAAHVVVHTDVYTDEDITVLNNNIPGAEGGERCVGDALGDSVFVVPRSPPNPVKDNPVLLERMIRNSPFSSDLLIIALTFFPSVLFLTMREKSTSM